MRVVDFSRQGAEPVTLFDSVSAASVHVADGAGEAHVHCVYFAPGGQIGPHAAGFGQLFMVVNGEGWAAGADGASSAARCGARRLLQSWRDPLEGQRSRDDRHHGASRGAESSVKR